jgi:hypothetical protein
VRSITIAVAVLRWIGAGFVSRQRTAARAENADPDPGRSAWSAVCSLQSAEQCQPPHRAPAACLFLSATASPWRSLMPLQSLSAAPAKSAPRDSAAGPRVPDLTKDLKALARNCCPAGTAHDEW